MEIDLEYKKEMILGYFNSTNDSKFLGIYFSISLYDGFKNSTTVFNKMSKELEDEISSWYNQIPEEWLNENSPIHVKRILNIFNKHLEM